MKGYVEKNLRKNEKVVAKCHVTWIAFVPIIVRALLIIALGWLLAYVFAETFIELQDLASGDIEFWASETYGMMSAIATIIVVTGHVVGIGFAIIPILKLINIELVVTDKKIIGKTGVIYSNAIDAYLEKIDNLAIDESLWGRIFKYSTITIGTASTMLKFPYMQNAVEFKNKVMDCYDARKTSLMTEQAVLIREQTAAAEQSGTAEPAGQPVPAEPAGQPAPAEADVQSVTPGITEIPETTDNTDDRA